MFRSLYSRLAAVVLALFLLTAVLVVTVFVVAVDMYRQEISQKLNRDLAENIVKENLLVENSRINNEALEHIFHMMMVINPSIELYLLDREGGILTYSAAPGKVKLQRVRLDPLKSWLQGGFKSPLYGEDPRNPVKKKVFSAAEILQNGVLQGYLYIILGGEDYDSIAQKMQNSFILKISSWGIVAGLITALIIGLVIFAMLTRRLEKLAVGIREFQTGKDITAIELPKSRKGHLRGDEIDHLSETFREMAHRIEEQVERIQQTDHMRRELIANVSHDLRTPLATLTAYIETLQLKDDTLSEDEQRKYLKIIRKHCERLNSLVNDLFELSRLDGAETTLEIEPFSLAELVQDVVQNYELPARKKNVTLETNCLEQQHFVVGDIRLVERVLENLISNGLRHTPEGGTVSVGLSSSEHAIKVQVLDTGIGIAEEYLPHIFDRYHSTTTPDQSSVTFTGLGLAIAKRIMVLHGSTLEVESKLNTGTCFTFDLPLHSQV